MNILHLFANLFSAIALPFTQWRRQNEPKLLAAFFFIILKAVSFADSTTNTRMLECTNPYLE